IYCIFTTTDWTDMPSRNSSNKPVGVIGVGSFGTAIANLLAEKNQVMVYSRNAEVVVEINQNHTSEGRSLHQKIHATGEPKYICAQCAIPFPDASSSDFSQVMRTFSRFLHPYHNLIHGTNGFCLDLPQRKSWHDVQQISREKIYTLRE